MFQFLSHSLFPLVYVVPMFLYFFWANKQLKKYEQNKKAKDARYWIIFAILYIIVFGLLLAALWRMIKR